MYIYHVPTMYMVFLSLEIIRSVVLELLTEKAMVNINSVAFLGLFCFAVTKPQQKTVVLEMQFTISGLGLAG